MGVKKRNQFTRREASAAIARNQGLLFTVAMLINLISAQCDGCRYLAALIILGLNGVQVHLFSCCPRRFETNATNLVAQPNEIVVLRFRQFSLYLSFLQLFETLAFLGCQRRVTSALELTFARGNGRTFLAAPRTFETGFRVIDNSVGICQLG